MISWLYIEDPIQTPKLVIRKNIVGAHKLCPINEPNAVIDGELQLIDTCHNVTVDKNTDYSDDLQSFQYLRDIGLKADIC